MIERMDGRHLFWISVLFFKTWFLYVTLAVLVRLCRLGWPWTQRCTCFCLLTAGTKVVPLLSSYFGYFNCTAYVTEGSAIPIQIGETLRENDECELLWPERVKAEDGMVWKSRGTSNIKGITQLTSRDIVQVHYAFIWSERDFQELVLKIKPNVTGVLNLKFLHFLLL